LLAQLRRQRGKIDMRVRVRLSGVPPSGSVTRWRLAPPEKVSPSDVQSP